MLLWKDPPFSSWVNPLFLWPFSIVFCMFTRGYIIKRCSNRSGSRLPEELVISQANKADFIQAEAGEATLKGPADVRCLWHPWKKKLIVTGWWFGTGILFFHSVGEMSSSQLTNPYFFRGVAQPPTRWVYWGDSQNLVEPVKWFVWNKKKFDWQVNADFDFQSDPNVRDCVYNTLLYW